MFKNLLGFHVDLLHPQKKQHGCHCHQLTDFLSAWTAQLYAVYKSAQLGMSHRANRPLASWLASWKLGMRKSIEEVFERCRFFR